jgi:chromate transporter
MMYWDIFLAFFIPGITGYGGGPASIPLIEYEVVQRFGWMDVDRFAELLALGNTLPGPIATKMAGYIGYEVGGLLGAGIALFASVAPSLLAMLLLLGVLYKFKDHPRVQNMTLIIKPVIAVLLGLLAYQFLINSWQMAGSIHTVILLIVSFYLLYMKQIHPAYMICGAFVYGALIIPFF